MHGHYYRTMCYEWRKATFRYREEQLIVNVSDDDIGNAQPRRRKGKSACE